MLHPSKTSAEQQKCKPFRCFMHAAIPLAVNFKFPFLFGLFFPFSYLVSPKQKFLQNLGIFCVQLIGNLNNLK